MIAPSVGHQIETPLSPTEVKMHLVFTSTGFNRLALRLPGNQGFLFFISNANRGHILRQPSTVKYNNDVRIYTYRIKLHIEEQEEKKIQYV